MTSLRIDEPSSPPGPAERFLLAADPPPAQDVQVQGQEGGAPGPVDLSPMTRHEFDGERAGRARKQLWSERAKAFAVALAAEVGDSNAARELGLHQTLVSGWRRDAGLPSKFTRGSRRQQAAKETEPAEELEEEAPVLQLESRRRRRDIGHGTIGNQKPPPREKSPKSGMQWDCPPPRISQAPGVPLPEAPETIVVARQQCSLCSEVVELEVSSRMPETEKALALHKAIGEHQHARHGRPA